MICTRIDGAIVDGAAMQASDWHPDFNVSNRARRRYGITKAEVRELYPDASITFWQMQYEIRNAQDYRTGYTTNPVRKPATYY